MEKVEEKVELRIFISGFQLRRMEEAFKKGERVVIVDSNSRVLPVQKVPDEPDKEKEKAATP